MSDPNSFDFVELQFAADDISIAVDEISLMVDVELRVNAAKEDALSADSDIDRLAAELNLQTAYLDQIAALATSSRVTWELGQILDSDS